jgi:thiol:disulfide interchange protein DsbD
MRRATFVSACLLFFAATSFAQLKKPESVHVFPPDKPVKAVAGTTMEMPILINVVQGFHINAEKPTFDYMIPTKLEWLATDLKLDGTAYPPAVKKEFEFAPGEKLDVYENDVRIVSKFQVPKTAKPAKLTLQGKLRYQACDNKACYPPVTVPFQAPVEIVKKK